MGAPYLIYAPVDLSGVSPEVGRAKSQGLCAAVDVLNAEGGVLGHEVAIEVVDTGGVPEAALALCSERMAASPSPNLVFASNDSAQQLALLPTLTKRGLLSISTNNAAAINDPGVYPYTFSTMVTQASQCQALVAYTLADHPKRVALITKNDPVGTTARQQYVGAFNAVKVPCESIAIEREATDVTEALKYLRSSDPDVLIIVAATGRSTIAILNGRRAIDWPIPVIGDGGSSALPLSELLPSDALHDVRLQYYAVQRFQPKESRSGYFAGFLEAVCRRGPITQSLITYSAPFDAVIAAARATSRARTSDAEVVARTLENLPHADRSPYITYREIAFSPRSHMIEAPASDFFFGEYRPVLEGMVPASAGQR